MTTSSITASDVGGLSDEALQQQKAQFLHTISKIEQARAMAESLLRENAESLVHCLSALSDPSALDKLGAWGGSIAESRSSVRDLMLQTSQLNTQVGSRFSSNVCMCHSPARPTSRRPLTHA